MHIALRDLGAQDLDTVYRWSQDPVFCQANGWTLGLTHDQLRHWWTALLQTPRSHLWRMGIVLDGQLVGFTELSALDGPGVPSFGIAIGESGLWGKGIGQQAGQLMLRLGFEHLQLPEIQAEVHLPNLRSLRLMSRLGFQRQGFAGQQEPYMGQLVDVVVFRILREAFPSDVPVRATLVKNAAH